MRDETSRACRHRPESFSPHRPCAFPAGFLLLASGAAFATHAFVHSIRIDEVDVAVRALEPASPREDVFSFDYLGCEVSP